jgi:hypothetical protein
MEFLDSPPNHELFDFPNGLGWVEPLRTDIDAIHDGVASKEAVGILEIVEPLARGLITAVSNETVGLQEPGWAHKFIWIPPKRGATR